MISDTIDIKARLTLYPTEKGERKTGIKTDYRPNHVFEYKKNSSDFITTYIGQIEFEKELISGETANRKIFDWAKGKEKQIWVDFKKDMYYDRYNNWIANYNSASEDSYPDLGYWIGYEICKSYYENATDKKQAIYDMLHIQEYRKFLEDSKREKKLEKMN